MPDVPRARCAADPARSGARVEAAERCCRPADAAPRARRTRRAGPARGPRPLAAALVLGLLAHGARAAEEAGDDLPRAPLTTLERELGWVDLADVLPPLPVEGDGWTLRDGVLSQPGGAGDLLTTRAFSDLELRFDARVSAGGNSGVKLRVLPAGAPGRDGAPLVAPVGLEFQLLDDLRHADVADPAHRCGALYDLVARDGHPDGRLDVAGRWHRASVRLRGGRLEHRLDGVRLLRVALDGPTFAARLAASKFAGIPRFGADAGPILLQDHGDAIAFRDVRVRDLAALPGTPVALPPFGVGETPAAATTAFDARDARALGGDDDGTWFALGDARWLAHDDEILGEVDGGAQSFLVSRGTFGDAILELELVTEDFGNSGIQVRSRVSDARRLSGYQVEIDPSPRAWSGGLYDEARRGWLDDLSERPEARAAFRPGVWTRYRIELAGPSIRTFVDDVPCADVLDPLDVAGHLAFQVHQGTNTRVRFRGLRVRDLGTRAWEPLGDASSWRPVDGADAFAVAPDAEGRASLVAHGSAVAASACARPLGDDALRLDLRASDGARCAFALRVTDVGAALAAWRARDASDEGFADVPLPDGGRLLVLPRSADDAPHAFAVCAYGDRVAAHLDGARLLDVRDGRLAARGALVLLARLADGATLAASRPERLGEPR